jgi:predicted nucleic acid-binding protein
MNGRFFLDTNVFVYTFDPVAKRKAALADLLINQAFATGKGVISYQVAQEFFSVALRRFANPMSANEAEAYLTNILHPLLAVHSSKEFYVEALHLQSRYKFSWYDSLIVAAAKQAECEVLFTEDLQHGQKIGNLRIENPFL